MQLIKQTPAQFHAKLPPHWAGGVALVVFGLALIFFFGRTVHIELNRTDGRVDAHLRETLFGIPISHSRWRGITGARVQSTRENKAHRTVLSSTSGEHPLTALADPDLVGKNQKVKTINAFLAAPEKQRLAWSASPGWHVYAWAFILLFGGLRCMAERAELRMDKETDTFTLLRKGLFGSKLLSYRLSDIERFELRSFTGKTGTTYKPGVLLRNGTFVGLHRVATPRLEPKQFIVDRLQKFFESHSDERKRCVICGQDCSTETRLQDPAGRYYHPQCYALH